MIVATALVLMMTIPGLPLFYSDMVRKKNVLATMAQSLSAVAMISILWVAFGYSLVFVGHGPWLGTLDRWLLTGMPLDSVNPAAKAIPEALFVLYQMTFAIITVALVAGSVADRMRSSAYLLLLAAWWCICPPSGFVTPLQGIVIGVTAGLVWFLGLHLARDGRPRYLAARRSLATSLYLVTVFLPFAWAQLCRRPVTPSF